MTTKCSTCSHDIPRGEIFFTAIANCLLPESIPDKHKTYSQNLLATRLKDFDDFIICSNCVQRLKQMSPVVTKPKPVKRDIK